MVHILPSLGDRSLRSLVDLEQGLISREIYVNEDIYKQELEQVYGRAWLFIGHESLVPNPGDFFKSRMGEESVILVRDHKGVLHVFLNTCRHRGMKVCRYDDGNTRLFTCPFHGWSYDTDGKLVGVPHFKTAFHEELDKSEFGLYEVGRICNFYGSIWATWDRDAPPFEDYLGAYADGVRRCFESMDGVDNGVELFRPVQRWRLPCNWKFPAFSFDGDRMHGVTTHRSINVAAIGPQGDRNEGDRHPMRARFPSTNYEMSIRELGHGGHNAIYDLPGVAPYVDTWQTEPPEVDEYYRQAREKKAKKYEGQFLHGGGALIFPNVNIQEQRILHWHPHGVGATESWRFYQVDRNAPKVVKDAQRRYMMRYCGPAGLTESDDMENWNYASEASTGAMARRLPYPFKAGLGHDYTDDRVPGMTLNFDIAEENQRSRLARWLAFMEAGSWNDLYPLNKGK
ncbi:MAG: aromatic ring-hydroxylating dioxygenase subunit alpha [Chloroflexota bacterium]|nr:aromatic ring-hydroxylating dioxygenase subunit alpha [Chloroflexota bacterium]MDE2885179.1 aromatic ring-hydroxylating dioxygenase subunit alpha [Chloroflexota bacterium]